jgi:hypothetical protein
MAILARPISNGSHWYLRDTGEACHEVLKADGSGHRNTNISDARKMRLLPSVTNVLSVIAKDGLTNWKLTKVAEAALANPKRDDETVEYWIDRIMGESGAETADAADNGTRVHKAIEAALAGEEYNEALRAYVAPVLSLLEEKKITTTVTEHRIINPREGYAGTMDFAGTYGGAGRVVLDFKTKRTKPGKKIEAYDTYGLQLAAYSAVYMGVDAIDDVLHVNVFISSTEPGRVEFYNWNNTHRPRDLYETFLNTCALWRFIRGYDPRG